MPKRRGVRRRGRGINAAALLLLAFLAGALVTYALLPRAHPALRRVAPRSTPQPAVSPIRTTVEPTPAAPVSPRPTPLQTPIAAPSATSATSGARVAIIIDDCGQWIDTERAYIALPIPLTLAVLPYVRYSAVVSREAAAAGKGVMLHLPMQPISHLYPGPGEITTAMSDSAIREQVQNDLDQVPLAKGVNNHEGSAATADRRVMEDVDAVLRAHDLFFIDSLTTAKSVAAEVARENGIPTASRNVFLDDVPEVAYTERMLEQTVADAKRNGFAIAIGHPKPTTLQALTLMYPRMEAQGVRFVLVQSLVK